MAFSRIAKIITACTASLAALGGLIVWATAPEKISYEEYKLFQNRFFAHRGLHTKDRKVPENSPAAFRRAVEKGYGIELDVQLSWDGEVVVFHDDDLKRVCGVDAAVDALTLRELKALSLCETDERIPLFTEVLKIVDGRVPLIVELKSGRHNAELCRKTLEILRSYDGPFCIESFDPRIVHWFRKEAPEIIRGQLACSRESYRKMSRFTAFFLANCLCNFYSRPNFIAYELTRKSLLVRLAERLGAKKVCWTSHDPADAVGKDTVIFEFYEPDLFF